MEGRRGAVLAVQHLAEPPNVARADAWVAGDRHRALKQRSFETREARSTVFEVEVDEIGPSLRYATAKVNKASRSGGGARLRQRISSAPRGASVGSAEASGGSVRTVGQCPASGSFGGGDDEPPF